MVAPVSVADPVCARLGDALEAAGRELGLPLRRAGTYMVMEGPQFSTRAESQLYRSWGCDVIGMTNMPEAKLAREAELCYATVRSEEHTSELQSLMRISYAVFCLKKKNNNEPILCHRLQQNNNRY